MKIFIVLISVNGSYVLLDWAASSFASVAMQFSGYKHNGQLADLVGIFSKPLLLGYLNS